MGQTSYSKIVITVIHGIPRIFDMHNIYFFMQLEGKPSQVLDFPVKTGFRITFLLSNLRAIELKTCMPYFILEGGSAVKLWKAGRRAGALTPPPGVNTARAEHVNAYLFPFRIMDLFKYFRTVPFKPVCHGYLI